MKTILHIGMPKTGTTALQDCLRASRPYLAERGILYPQNPPGCSFNNHRMLVFGFLPFEKLPRHIRSHKQYTKENYLEKHEEFLEFLYDQAAQTRPTCMILSSETLFGSLNAAGRRALPEALRPLGERITVAAYLRQPSEHYVSGLQQRLRQSSDLGLVKAPLFMRHLRRYVEAFGKEAVVPRVYERSALRNGDIIDDFLGTHLAEAPVDLAKLTRKAGGNTSLSAESMDLMRRYRRAFHRGADDVSTSDSTGLVRALRRSDQATGAGKPRLRPEVAEFIDYSWSDPLRLRDEYGIVFPRLDYRRLERRWLPWLPRLPRRPRSLSALVVIDASIQRDILEHLRGSRWAQESPERGAWIADQLQASSGRARP